MDLGEGNSTRDSFCREIRIKRKELEKENNRDEFKFEALTQAWDSFSLKVFIDNEGWMNVCLEIHSGDDMQLYPEDPQSVPDHIGWTVNIMDREGKCKHPKSFTLSDMEDPIGARYLKISFIRDGADEYFDEYDELTLLLYFIYDHKRSIRTHESGDSLERLWETLFVDSIPVVDIPKLSDKDGTEIGAVYDCTRQVLYLPEFCELRNRFGVYGIPPCDGRNKHFPPLAEPDENHIREHVWIVDAENSRFLISLDGAEDDLGPRLLQVSPFFRSCVQNVMRENREKRVRLPTVGANTFRLVLHYLRYKKLPFHEIKEEETLNLLYEAADYFQMDDLREKCAEVMSRNFDSEELEKMTDMYSDENLMPKSADQRPDLEYYS